MPNSRTVSTSVGRTPVYQKIARTLRDEIASGYAPGDVLPSEHALASRFGVNRHTVRRGVDELVEDGILVRQRGRGTVVLSTPIDFPITLDRRYSQLIRQTGHSTSNRILTRKLVGAPQHVAEALDCPENTRVVYIEQLRLLDSMPLTICRHWLPDPAFRCVLDDYTGGSLHALIKTRLGLDIRLASATVSAGLPSADDALNLQISPKAPVLQTILVDVDAANARPVEYVTQVFRADATRLVLSPGPEPAVEAFGVTPDTKD